MHLICKDGRFTGPIKAQQTSGPGTGPFSASEGFTMEVSFAVFPVDLGSCASIDRGRRSFSCRCLSRLCLSPSDKSKKTGTAVMLSEPTRSSAGFQAVPAALCFYGRRHSI